MMVMVCDGDNDNDRVVVVAAAAVWHYPPAIRCMHLGLNPSSTPGKFRCCVEIHHAHGLESKTQQLS